MRVDGDWGYFEVYGDASGVTITLPSSITVGRAQAQEIAAMIAIAVGDAATAQTIKD